MERFLAICHPLHLYTMSGLQRAVRIIAALWIISFISAVPFGIFTKIHYIDYPPSNTTSSAFYLEFMYLNLIFLTNFFQQNEASKIQHSVQC